MVNFPTSDHPPVQLKPHKSSLGLPQKRRTKSIKHSFLQLANFLKYKGARNCKHHKAQTLAKYFGKKITLVRCRRDVGRLHEKMKSLIKINLTHRLGEHYRHIQSWGGTFSFRNVYINYDASIILRKHKFTVFKVSDYGQDGDDDSYCNYFCYLDGYCTLDFEFDLVRLQFRYTVSQPREYIRFERAVETFIRQTDNSYYCHSEGRINLSELQFFAEVLSMRSLFRFHLRKLHKDVSSDSLQVLLQHLKSSMVCNWLVVIKLDDSEFFTTEESSDLLKEDGFIKECRYSALMAVIRLGIKFPFSENNNCMIELGSLDNNNSCYLHHFTNSYEDEEDADDDLFWDDDYDVDQKDYRVVKGEHKARLKIAFQKHFRRIADGYSSSPCTGWKLK